MDEIYYFRRNYQGVKNSYWLLVVGWTPNILYWYKKYGYWYILILDMCYLSNKIESIPKIFRIYIKSKDKNYGNL